MSAPLGSLSFQQAAHLELHFNPNTNAVCVKLAAMTKGRYSFMILRMLELVSGISLPPLGVQFKEEKAGLSTLTQSSECGIVGFEDFDCSRLLYCGREDGEYQLELHLSLYRSIIVLESNEFIFAYSGPRV